MNILITGGAGFIGTALANKLQENHEVILLDLEHKFNTKHSSFEKIAVDITNEKEFETLEDYNVDFVFHLAAQTSGAISQEDPTLDVDTNVKGTLNLLNYARKAKVKKVIFTSSMTTYGITEGKVKENYIQKPLSNYGVSKVCGENYIEMFKQYEIEYTIFRLFNVFGPGQDLKNMKQGMLSIFMAQSILQNTINVTGSLDRFRDFVYIDDVVSALALGLNPKTDDEIYNVGSETKTTVGKLINTIINVNDKPTDSFEVVNIGGHDGDQFGIISDCSKIKKLGWSQKTNFDEGLLITYKAAKKELS